MECAWGDSLLFSGDTPPLASWGPKAELEELRAGYPRYSAALVPNPDSCRTAEPTELQKFHPGTVSDRKNHLDISGPHLRT